MTERMTDERLAEIESKINSCNTWPAEKYFRELLQALKAERAAFNELKDRVKNGFQGGCWCCESVATKNIELEAMLRAVGELPGKWRPKGIGYLGAYEAAQVHCAAELEALLKGEE